MLLKNSKGFTLIELIIVLVIIGLAASVTFISIGIAHKKLIIRDTAKRYYLTLRQAKILSATKRIETAVLIDPEDGTYRIASVRRTEQEGEEKLVFQTIKRYYPPRDIIIEGDDLFFYPLGGSSGGQVLIKDNENRAYRIWVDKITGKIRLQRLG
ncbi:MAG: prepilin-type N-terminal cleavage/methylation domain-containing protein [Nitrospirae bacterium]|nr:prepilin-type N-terminal cleavage/methylation domain-containing protein [Nitrospirota bacterium]